MRPRSNTVAEPSRKYQCILGSVSPLWQNGSVQHAPDASSRSGPNFPANPSSAIKISRSLSCLVLLVLATSARAGDRDSLEQRLRPLIDGFKGRVAIAVKHLDTGETFLWHETDPMPTASLIKFPVMIEAYRQSALGQIDLNAPVTLRKEDKVPGSGILTYHFSDNATFPLRDAVHLMIVYSDNTATNLVLDKIGIPSTARTMEAMGYPNTKIHSKVFRRDTSVFPDRSKQFGLGSTTAVDMIKLCESLYKHELVSTAASEEMLKHLLACDDKDKFPRFLPPGTKVAFKTGSVDGTRTAAGIITTRRGPVALCVLSADHADGRFVPDNAGNRLCADVAKAVFDYYVPEPKSAGTSAATPRNNP